MSDVGKAATTAAPLSERARRHRWPLWVGLLFAAGFVLHASNYLYFFVDDEAIPFVYAQNILNGKGLAYNGFEGRVEGYSDFLHVWFATVVLGSVRALGLNTLSVFHVGTVVSLLAGMGSVLVTFLILRMLPRIRPPGLVTGLVFLALAGPLAVWSCSSLEEVEFGFLIVTLTFFLVRHAEGEPLSRWAALCAAGALLVRIDGFVYVGAVTLGFVLISDRAHHRDLFRHLILPVLLVFAAYHAWRIWYFGEWLSMPMYTKVMYKLRPDANVIVKAPEQNYAVAFFRLYGVWPLALVCTAGTAYYRDRIALACLCSAGCLIAYVAVVGDWMFGFRFFVPVLPLLAVLIAYSVSAVAEGRRTIGWVVTGACVVWFSVTARAFDRTYLKVEQQEHWLTHPTMDPRLHFRRYYGLLEEIRQYMHPGDVVAFNQAGLIPFMLDLDNIDDIGLCSKFYAKLPTTDLYFTEAGRYEPLTDKTVVHAGAAYLLYKEPSYIIEPVDLLRKANDNRIPEELLAGHYRLRFVDPLRLNAVYERTSVSVRQYQTQPTSFLENLAHISHLKAAHVNQMPVPVPQWQRTFPWLMEGKGRFTVGPAHAIELAFSNADQEVHEIHLHQMAATRPMAIVLALRSTAGAVVYEKSLNVPQDSVQDFHDYLPTSVRAGALTIDVKGAFDGLARLELNDLRVQGQSPALQRYIAETLPFPAPSGASRSRETH